MATGIGEPALALAEAVAPRGHVTATDLVPDYLVTAKKIAEERGLTNITFQQANAEALPFPDRTFDVVTSRLGLMHFADVQKALQEMHRVLKPGGRAAFAVWGPMEQNPSHTCTIGILRRFLPPPEPRAPNPHRFDQPGSLSAELKSAGFQDVQEEAITVPWHWPGPVEEAWEAARQRQASFRRAYESLSAEQREEVAREAYDLIRPYYDGQQVKWPALIRLASAIRSA